jgi:hypothetical protein
MLKIKKTKKALYKAYSAAVRNGRFAWPSVSIITEDQPSLYFLPMFEIAFNRHDYWKL